MTTRKMPNAKKMAVRDLKPQDKKTEDVKGGYQLTLGTITIDPAVKGRAYDMSDMAQDLKK